MVDGQLCAYDQWHWYVSCCEVLKYKNSADGTLYKPFIDKNYEPYLFVSDIARHVLKAIL